MKNFLRGTDTGKFIADLVISAIAVVSGVKLIKAIVKKKKS